jgi:Tol biopolymer transport system component
LGRRETFGEPVPVAEQIGSSITRAFFSVSANGVLVYRGGGGINEEINWYDRQGRALGPAEIGGEYQDLALSPSGTHLAYNRITQGTTRQIWILDIARAINSRLTFIPEGARGPAWSPDGHRIAFSGIAGTSIYIQDVATGGSAEQIFQTPATNVVSAWTRDGRYLLYTQTTAAFDVWALSVPAGGGERKAIAIANSENAELHGQVSPDSRWVAYDSTESGRYEVYVRPFPPGDGRVGKWLVSSNGGQLPRWRGDSAELFYLSLDRTFIAVDTKTQPGFQSATPHPLFSLQTVAVQSMAAVYDVAPDGKRFIVITPGKDAISAPATVLLNWEQTLKK